MVYIYYDYDIIIFIITLIITLGAQAYISLKYSSTRKIKATTGLSGRDVARKILDANGLENVRIAEVSGELTDHYDPRNKTVNLSSDIYNGTSVASYSVASHECGHAIQDKDGYLFLRIRSSIVPLVNFSSRAGYFAILFGLIFSWMDLLFIGIIFEAVILLFQLITLPVEFNASHRALGELEKLNLVTEPEHSKARGMLIAAALTYVASVATAILEILRLLLIFSSRDDR